MAESMLLASLFARNSTGFNFTQYPNVKLNAAKHVLESRNPSILHVIICSIKLSVNSFWIRA